jgi:hypothetical protein
LNVTGRAQRLRHGRDSGVTFPAHERGLMPEIHAQIYAFYLFDVAETVNLAAIRR